MTESNHQPNFDDELLGDESLSAYVDGELQGDELAQVEQRLAADPAARQLVDELRALSGELQSLPPAAVGESLRSSVMQRAERAMLLGADDQQTFPKRETGSSRRWAWAAMALAATLLLSLYLPEAKQAEKTIADAKPLPEKPPPSELRFEATEQPMEASEEALVANQATGNNEVTQGENLVAENDDVEAMASSSAVGGGGGYGGEVPSKVADVERYSQAAPAMRSRAPQAPAAARADKADSIDDLLACEVHITMGNGSKSVAQFDRFLEQVGIAVRDDVHAAQTDASQPAEPQDGRQPSDQAHAAKPAVQYVLVKAPLQPIEAALAACNLDTFNCATIRVVDQSEGSAATVDKLRQLERAVDEPPAAKVAEQNALSKKASRAKLGYATRIDRANDGLSDRRQLDRPQLSHQKMGRQRLSDQRMVLSEGAPAGDPVQVLFVLHPAADLRKPATIESE